MYLLAMKFWSADFLGKVKKEGGDQSGGLQFR